MRINKNTDYGLIFLKRLVQAFSKKEYLSVSQIASIDHIPEQYLKKIAGQLKKAKLIKAREGKSGGYILTKPPEKITLDKVMLALEGSLDLSPCACCSQSAGACGFSNFWEEVGSDWQTYFKNIKLSDI